MAERNIRKLLKERVESYGGEIRAVSWLGRPNAPDVLCLFPEYSRYDLRHRKICWEGESDPPRGHHLFVETKAPGGVPNAAQVREHERMRAAGCTVLVVSTKSRLDE